MGDAGGVYVANLLPPSTKYPKGYQRIMKIFKSDLLASCKSADFKITNHEAQFNPLIAFVKEALSIHTNTYALARIGSTASSKKLTEILRDKH